LAIFVVLLPKTNLLNTYLLFLNTQVFTKLALILLNISTITINQ